jgi:hypothetical protein
LKILKLKSFFLTIALSILVSFVFAQQTVIDSTIYASEILDIKPIYGDGASAMFKAIAQNLTFPPIIRQRLGDIGTAYVSFVVDENGKLDEKSVKLAMFMAGISDKDSIPKRIFNEAKLDTIQAVCVKEAFRVVKLLQNWTPAKVDGKAVKCRHSVPIRFKNEGFTWRK